MANDNSNDKHMASDDEQETNSKDTADQTVLITGASSGIGLELAKLFAKDGYRLILSSGNEVNLREAAATLGDVGGSVEIIVEDLSVMGGAERLYEKCQNKNIDVLVNDAGVGSYGAFSEVAWSDYDEIIHLNVVALTQLTKLILPSMLQRNSGKILNLASIAAFQPGPKMSVYYASKAYVLSLSLALSEELKKSGVSVTALCPGPTETHFAERANMENTRAFNSPLPMSADKVAEIGFKALMAGERMVIAGFRNKVTIEMLRLMPEALNTKLSAMLLEEVEVKSSAKAL